MRNSAEATNHWAATLEKRGEKLGVHPGVGTTGKPKNRKTGILVMAVPVVSACARAYPPDARPLSPARRTRRPSSSLHRENGRRPRSDDIIIEAAIFQDPQAHDSHWKTGGTIARLREELGRIETVMARLTRTPHPLYIQGPQPFVHHIPNLHAPQGLLHFPFTSLTLIDVVAGPAVALFKDTSYGLASHPSTEDGSRVVTACDSSQRPPDTPHHQYIHDAVRVVVPAESKLLAFGSQVTGDGRL
ncbi:hypothetical protein FB45DRAFT_1013225 [Roridomyces roridus]|uniref:Uncharacterized protein n=1 Tax=Roridomyces roridus TaxID=1738132 RepID=A0AAD7AYY5_9AGAR|nr:hypothetical protein FB45DRAFT_1013225 [Roridomyces roridus]